MAPVVQTLQNLLTAGDAYISDGHLLCPAGAAPDPSHDYVIPRHLKRAEDDVLMWTPHTVLGLRADRCIEAPWSTGHPTINATRLAADQR